MKNIIKRIIKLLPVVVQTIYYLASLFMIAITIKDMLLK